MNDLLETLNNKQREAVLATEGPILILAGPGSGKTKTLTHRIAHLIHKGVAPEHILAVTFTNKAAEEMKRRIGSLLSAISSGHQIPPTMPFIGTFHSLAVRILRVHAPLVGYGKNYSIADQDDVVSLIKDIMKELNINPKQFAPVMVVHAISSLKSDLITPDHYEETTGLQDIFPKMIHSVYAQYQKRLKDSNIMDFDDLLMNACALFQNHSDVLAAYQNRFRYIHVDEYQDTDRNQYVLVTSLAKKHRNIAVVGDDAQSIYSFRGADLTNILNFEKDWPDAKVIVLDQNYRSTQTILDAAGQIISRNKTQKEKKLWTENQKGDPIKVFALANERMEANFVVDSIQNHIRTGYHLRDMVVLYRTNAQSRSIEEALLSRNLPYRLIGGVKFYQRKEIKDVLAYLRFIVNPADAISLKRIINTPTRGVGKKSLAAYLARRSEPDEQASLLKATARAEQGVAAFEALMTDLRQQTTVLSPSALIKHLLHSIRYQAYLEEDMSNPEERWQNVEELVNLAARYDGNASSPEDNPDSRLEKMLEDATLMSETDNIQEQTDLVHLMTLHAAKGLEFPIVFIIGLEEGIFPHARSMFNPHELEEERRLCYVGLTRAKERVYLLFALSRTQFGSTQMNPPSRFLNEIPDHLIELSDEGLGNVYLD